MIANAIINIDFYSNGVGLYTKNSASINLFLALDRFENLKLGKIIKLLFKF